MSDRPGLRELKKQRTHAAISDAAIRLFVERGYGQVSVAEVAEAAEVSKRTLFSYFPAKEDLVVHRFADHETEQARVVRGRPERSTPLTALRAHFLDGLRRRDPFTGLNDDPEVRDLYRLVLRTPSLIARMGRFRSTAEQALAEALQESADTPGTMSRVAAAQLVAVHWALAQENARRLTCGQSADERYPEAVTEAEDAFAMLEQGIGAGRREGGTAGPPVGR